VIQRRRTLPLPVFLGALLLLAVAGYYLYGRKWGETPPPPAERRSEAAPAAAPPAGAPAESAGAAPPADPPAEAGARPAQPATAEAAPAPAETAQAEAAQPEMAQASPAPAPPQAATPPAVAAAPGPPPIPTPAPPAPAPMQVPAAAPPPPPQPRAAESLPENDGTLAEARRALAAGDHLSALALLEPLAEAGEAAAEALLGLMYARGAGVAADPARAFDLFGKAAQGRDPEGQFRYAESYRDGFGTKADPVRALAWLMHAAARGHGEAAAARDRMLTALDETARVQADSQARSLPVPLPAGWLADDRSGLKVWSPSWYRNGTFRVQIDGQAVDGVLDGPGRVRLTATLKGRSDRTFEGTFRRGLLLDEALASLPGRTFELLESDEMRLPLDVAAAGQPAMLRLWRQTQLKSMQLEACPAETPRLYAVMAEDFTGVDDAEVRRVAVGAVQALLAVCRLPATTPAWVHLLPPEHREVYERGDTTFQPRLADVQLYGFDQPPEAWSVSLSNHARQAHERSAYEAEQQRKRAERERKLQRETAAALARPMPDVRGFRLGLPFEAFKAQLGDAAATWEPKLEPERKPAAYGPWRQKVTLRDGSSLTGTFASTQNGTRLLALGYEQHLRDGPDPEAMRQQLYAKYGQPDEEAGNRTWLTWWLRSEADGEPRGAALKGRLQTDGAGRVAYLALTLVDFNFTRRDEQQGVAARRQAERDAHESRKSDKPRF